MSRTRWLTSAVVLAAVIAVGTLVWLQRTATAPEHPLANIRPADPTSAIEIPQSPYLVIPNELVVQLREGYSVEAFSTSLTGDEIRVIGWIPTFRIVQVEISAAERESRKAELESNPLVLAVTYQSVFKKNATLNDPVFTNQNPDDDWNLKAIRAEAAWDITRGKPEVIIAVVDGGTLLEHEELKGKIVKPASPFSDDRRSMVGSSEVLEHGTHVAITAAGAGDNGFGTSGVCPNCRVMPVQVALEDGTDLTAVVSGIEYAMINGAKVINLSMAPSIKASRKKFGDRKKRPQVLKEMSRQFRGRIGLIGNIFKRVESWGALLVVGAGNNNLPGDFNNFCQAGFTLCVGAAEKVKDGTLEWTVFSDYGFAVTVSAPGKKIYSGTGEANGRGYAHLNGTSMATPHVSGLAGLIYSAHPDLKPDEVRAIILASSFANNSNRQAGIRWYTDFRYAHRDLELWRRAFLRLLGKDESKLINGPMQSLLGAIVPKTSNTVWGWPYDTSNGKGNKDKAFGRFIDAKAALDLAANKKYRERFVAFSAADLKKALSIDREQLTRLHDMLWYEGRFKGSAKIGSGFSLAVDPSSNRLIVKRDSDPGSGYEEWFEYRSLNTYQHHARHNGQIYSFGTVKLRLRSDRLIVTPAKTGSEIVYEPK